MRTGLWVAAGVAGVVLTIFFLDEIRRMIQEGPVLVVATSAAPELRPGSELWIAGRPAGRVISVKFRPPDTTEGTAGNVIVTAVVRRDAARFVRRDGTARIRPADLLEPVVLAVDPGSPSQPPFDFADTMRTAPVDISPEQLLSWLDSLRTVATTRRPLTRRLGELAREGSGTVAAWRRDPAVRRDLEVTRAALRAIRLGDGSLGRIVRDTALRATFGRVMSRWEEIAARRDSLDRLRESTGPALGPTLEAIGSRLAGLDERLAGAYGTAGRALHDEAILREARLLRARLDSVVSELAGNPLRWLRFRLF